MFVVKHHMTLGKDEFVEFWSSQYDYPDSYLYGDNIGRNMTDKSVLELFRWKNGRQLSGLKENSVYEKEII